MAIQQHIATLKFRDNDWKALGRSRIQIGSVACSLELTEGTDFEINYHLGLVRRLRELPDRSTGLCGFTFDYDDRVEEIASAEQARVDQRAADAALVIATLPTREAKDAMARLLGVSP